jgi:uncharacterized protein (DUF2336 family)
VDDIEVARPLLEESNALSDADLVHCVLTASVEHLKLVARRRDITEIVGEVLVDRGDAEVIRILLRNDGSRVSRSRSSTGWSPPPATSPRWCRWSSSARSSGRARAYVMFWWADAEARRIILQRFAVSREVLQEAAGDVFAIAASEGWQDAPSRKALQFIERRQRNRAAIEKSPYESLEDAVAAAQGGMASEGRRRDQLPGGRETHDRGQDLRRRGRGGAGGSVQGHGPAQGGGPGALARDAAAGDGLGRECAAEFRAGC